MRWWISHAVRKGLQSVPDLRVQKKGGKKCDSVFDRLPPHTDASQNGCQADAMHFRRRETIFRLQGQGTLRALTHPMGLKCVINASSQVKRCSCGCDSEYYGVCVDHFSNYIMLKPFKRKVQGPVADWFQACIDEINGLPSAYKEPVARGYSTLHYNQAEYAEIIDNMPSIFDPDEPQFNHAVSAVQTVCSLPAQSQRNSNVVQDNGGEFVNSSVERVLFANGVDHKTCRPYHPQTEGKVERQVQASKYRAVGFVADFANLALEP